MAIFHVLKGSWRKWHLAVTVIHTCLHRHCEPIQYYTMADGRHVGSPSTWESPGHLQQCPSSVLFEEKKGLLRQLVRPRDH